MMGRSHIAIAGWTAILQENFKKTDNIPRQDEQKGL
jgi:hypothetical protein